MRVISLLAMLALGACGSATVDGDGGDDPGASGLDPAADEDGDGFSNGDEDAAGSDPNDASDVPYEGGWPKDDQCNGDVVSTGNAVGQVAEDFALLDQYGEEVHLVDFCDHVVLIYFTGFT